MCCYHSIRKICRSIKEGFKKNDERSAILNQGYALVQYALLIYSNKPLNTKPSNLYFNVSRLSVCDGRLGARIPNCNVKVL